MKKLITITLLCICQTFAFAQTKLRPLPKLLYGDKQFYAVSPSSSPVDVFMTIDKFTKWAQFKNDIPNQPLINYTFLEGAHKTRLSVSMPINDILNYGYSIIANDSTLLTSNFRANHATPTNDQKLLIELGDFDIANKKLTVEIFKLTDRSKVATAVIYNKPIEPPKMLVNNLKCVDLKNVEFAWVNLTNNFKFWIHDDQGRFASLRLAIKASDVTFMYHVYLKNMSTGRVIFVSNSWDYSINARMEIDASYFTDPGDYLLTITPEASQSFNDFFSRYYPEKIKRINFTVVPQENIFEKSLIAAATAFLVIVGSITGLVVFLVKRRARKKIQKAHQQKNIAQDQLSTVRSQLNPHFMFNALSGIQNLMNKNEVDQANRYLAKFARITRSVLNNKELTSLADESALLDDYLQMEQLRFGFKYKIEIGQGLNPENVEVPAMLLQPFVENAVKHGIAALDENGYIYISVISSDKDLVLSVNDNGKGFDVAGVNTGMGLALVKKRIILLNTLYEDAPILLDIQSKPGNTTLTVTLKQWL